jgi:hypothetical protein
MHLARRLIFGPLYQPRMMGDYECEAVDGMRIDEGNRSDRGKPAPVPLCSPHITRYCICDLTRTAAVGSWRLTA